MRYTVPCRRSALWLIIVVGAMPYGNHVTMDVLDIFGRKVMTLVDKYENKGNHEIVPSAEGPPSGMCFYRMEAPSAEE